MPPLTRVTRLPRTRTSQVSLFRSRSASVGGSIIGLNLWTRGERILGLSNKKKTSVVAKINPFFLDFDFNMCVGDKHGGGGDTIEITPK